MAAHACEAAGCGDQIGRGKFMCRPHWFGLPAPLRQQINATWRAYQRRAIGDHQPWLDYTEACDEARRWTAEKEGKLDQFEPRLPRLRKLYDMREDRHG